MLLRTTYTGDTVRRCDGCGHDHLGNGADVYRVQHGEREESVLFVARCCIVEFSQLYTRLQGDLIRRWSTGALALGAESMLDALGD